METARKVKWACERCSHTSVFILDSHEKVPQPTDRKQGSAHKMRLPPFLIQSRGTIRNVIVHQFTVTLCAAKHHITEPLEASKVVQ